MATTVKKLNAIGVDRFRKALESGRATGVVSFLEELRDNSEFHECSFSVTVDEASEGQFATAFDMAKYLSSHLLLKPEEIEGPSGFGDIGVWSWLTVWFFELLCPAKPDGTRNVGPDERYIPEVRAEFSFHRYYRHRLAGPYRIFQQHPEYSFPLLHTPLHKHSGLYRAVEEQQDLMQTPGVIEAIGLLYFDAAARRPKPGAIGSERAGSLRRFTEVVRQLDLTFDLHALSGHALVNLLPDEFNSWRPVSVA